MVTGKIEEKRPKGPSYPRYPLYLLLKTETGNKVSLVEQVQIEGTTLKTEDSDARRYLFLLFLFMVHNCLDMEYLCHLSFKYIKRLAKDCNDWTMGIEIIKLIKDSIYV